MCLFFFPGIVAFFANSVPRMEVVLTLNVHVGGEITHANKMAADNLDSNLAKKIVSAKT